MNAGLLLGLALTVAGARAQTASPVAAAPGQADQAYAKAKPYMDDPLPQLKHAVPALNGLKADASQLNLQSILARTGEVVQAQMPKIPDLAANESVWQAQLAEGNPGNGIDQGNVIFASGGRGRGRGPTPSQYPAESAMSESQLEEKLHASLERGAPWKDFNYMVLSRLSPDGIPKLEESRIDVHAAKGKGGRPEAWPNELHGTGFGYLWLLFLPENISQSNYRLLGQQKMYGHEAYVVTFAQSPDRVAVPGEITSLGITYPLYYQGVAWIDEATFRILRLRTDLLAPLPGIQVQWLSSDLQFREVRIPELNSTLWLPHQVELTWRQGDELVGELHLYAKYRLFHATARILPPS